MKLRVEVVVEDETGQEIKRVAVMEKHCAAEDSLTGGLGLSHIVTHKSPTHDCPLNT